MDIHTAAQYVRVGYKVKRSFMTNYCYTEHVIDNSNSLFFLSLEDLLSTDWEIIDDSYKKEDGQ